MVLEKISNTNFISVDTYDKIKVDLEKLIETTPSEIISKLYWEMELENNKTHPFNLEDISIPGNFWKEENDFENGIWELLETIEEKLLEFSSKGSFNYLYNQIINNEWKWTRLKISEYFELMDEYDIITDYVYHQWIYCNDDDDFKYKWFFIKLFKYHNIIDDNYRVNKSLNLGKMQREVTIDLILSDL